MDGQVVCAICGRYAAAGISILGKTICAECEKTIVNTDINNDSYDEYKNLIKRNIYNDMFI